MSSFFGAVIDEPKSDDTLIVPHEIIKTFFQVYNQDLDALPISLRGEVIKLLRPRQFSLTEEIITFKHNKPDMFFIVEGSALLFKTPYCYQKFLNSRK